MLQVASVLTGSLSRPAVDRQGIAVRPVRRRECRAVVCQRHTVVAASRHRDKRPACLVLSRAIPEMRRVRLKPYHSGTHGSAASHDDRESRRAAPIYKKTNKIASFSTPTLPLRLERYAELRANTK